MYFLSLDTATNSGGVAVARNAEVIGSAMLKTPLRYSDKIIYYIDFLLGQLDLDIGRIDCFVAAVGPGSFTGLRIGLATLKGLCHSLNRPAVGVSTLEALAFRFREHGMRVAPMIDARRQQIYGDVFECRKDGIESVHGPGVSPPAPWLKSLPPAPTLFVGDGAQMYSTTVAALRPDDRLLATDNRILDELCLLGYFRYLRGEAGAAETLRANYIRPSDAELSRS